MGTGGGKVIWGRGGRLEAQVMSKLRGLDQGMQQF